MTMGLEHGGSRSGGNWKAFHIRRQERVSSCFLKDSLSLSVVVNIPCPLDWIDWISNHLGGTPLGVLQRLLPEMLNQGGKTYPRCGSISGLGS